MNSSAVQPDSLSLEDAAQLAAGAAGADRARTLGADQLAVIHRRDWLRMLAPADLGGGERPLPEVVRLQEAIAAVDGSVGWLVTLGAGAGWFAGFLPPQVARRILATPRLCLAGSGAPDGTAERCQDGYRIRGQWRFATGAANATHFTFNAVLTEAGQPLKDDNGNPRLRAFVVPASAVEIVPDWRTLGLAATGSHSFRIGDALVAADHGFSLDQRTAEGPLYRFPFLAMAFVTLAANIAGMAAHFMTLAADLIASRRHPRAGAALGELATIDGMQRRARDELAQARQIFYRHLDLAWRQVCDGAAVDEATLRQAALALVAMARRAVNDLYPLCGLRAADAGSDINRVWRDFHTATQHALLIPDPVV